jgi:hypothetical protein
MKNVTETLEQGGYVSAKPIGDGEYILTDNEGKKELWFANEHCGYTILLSDGTQLEFARSIS